MSFFSFLRKNMFVFSLITAFLTFDLNLAKWDPVAHSLRFHKNDFVKSVMHNDNEARGPMFFGNSSVTAAFLPGQEPRLPLVEMGLSYGKLTDLKAILEKDLFGIEDVLVVGIDAHTMIDSLPTDPTYPWIKPWYVPYVYYYRDYLLEAGKEWWEHFLDGNFDYKPRWTGKMALYGNADDKYLREKWNEYNERFGGMTLKDFEQNLKALEWIIDYSKENQLPLRFVLMPWNPKYPYIDYMQPLEDEIIRILNEKDVPYLDVSDTYAPEYFYDLVHLNKDKGAPKFTREVNEWLLSFESSSKP